MTDISSESQGSDDASALLCVIVGEGNAKLWGLSGGERIRRLLTRAGVAADQIVGDTDPIASRVQGSSGVLLMRADHAFEEPLIPSLIATNDIALLPTDGSKEPAALHVQATHFEKALTVLKGSDFAESGLRDALRTVRPGDIAGTYNHRLRKKAEPYVLHVTPETRRGVQKVMFKGSYKGVTDIVTKYVFPWPSRHVTSLAASLGLKPNHVTFIGLISTLATIWLWWYGYFAYGLLTAWAMLVLDTVDGKLARTTLTSSKFGDIFDHSIDLIHPPFWYWAWIHGLGAEFVYPDWMLGVLVAGYILQRLQEGFFMKAFGIEMHIWRPFDSWFRSITARRDPNVAILTIAWALGFPAEGMAIVVAWTVICLGVHTYQIAHAGVAKARGQKISSWLAAPG